MLGRRGGRGLMGQEDPHPAGNREPLSRLVGRGQAVILGWVFIPARFLQSLCGR